MYLCYVLNELASKAGIMTAPVMDGLASMANDNKYCPHWASENVAERNYDIISIRASGGCSY